MQKFTLPLFSHNIMCFSLLVNENRTRNEKSPTFTSSACFSLCPDKQFWKSPLSDITKGTDASPQLMMTPNAMPSS